MKNLFIISSIFLSIYYMPGYILHPHEIDILMGKETKTKQLNNIMWGIDIFSEEW